MRAAWAADLPSGSDKLVLLALADFANEKGEAWPSVPTLSVKCSRGETAVREAIHRLAGAGHITRVDRAGQSAMMLVHPLAPPPETRSPTPPDFQGGSEIGRGSEIDTPTPPETRTPPLPISGGDPSLFPNPNPQEPPITPQSESPKTRARDAPTVPDWVPADAWNGFVDMRKKAKAPLTDRAVQLAIADLEKLRDEGHPPGAVLDQSTSRGWKGLFPLKDNRHGQQGSRSNNGLCASPAEAMLVARRNLGIDTWAEEPASNPRLRASIERARRDLP